jgi:hypothetical protein
MVEMYAPETDVIYGTILQGHLTTQRKCLGASMNFRIIYINN